MKLENIAPNHQVVTIDHISTLFSYGTAICQVRFDGIVLDRKYYNYSKTTSKYLYKFLCTDSKQFKKDLDKGLFIFDNLN
jgi:hypothetical protein